MERTIRIEMLLIITKIFRNLINEECDIIFSFIYFSSIRRFEKESFRKERKNKVYMMI